MTLFMDIALPLLVLGLIMCFFRFKHKKYYQNIPGPPKIPILGNALDFRSTTMILETMLRYMNQYGGVIKARLGPIKNVLMVTDYKMFEFILNNPKILTKTEDYKFLDLWLGTGLLLGSGPKWKKHRKILTPAFHFQILEEFIPMFASCGETLVQKLLKEVGKESVDISHFVPLCTLDVICETTMGTKINAQEDTDSDYVRSVHEMCRIIIERSTSPIQMHDLFFYFTKNYSIQKEAVKILHNRSNEVIEKRFEVLKNQNKENSEHKKKKVFLDLLLEATVDGRPLTKEEIREEVDTFMFAGHDTTGAAINFTLFCLANHPEVQRLVFEEQRQIFGGNTSQNVSYTDLQNMKYLEQVIKESLRLYPPVPIIGRQPDEDIHYENTCIPKGGSILLFLFGMHRNPKYFTDPEIFNPNRFENPDKKYPYSYIPFSGGPRNCIGQKYAMLEMKCIISKIIEKFELLPANPKHELQLAAETVLKAVNGVKIKLKLRC